VGIVMFLVFYIFLYKDPKKKAKDTESEIIEKSEMSDKGIEN
jgi:cbb3-type cytochrome oxidase subunit 3